MSFFPSDDKSGPPFWQQMLLVVVPTFVGACMPPVIAHFLEKSNVPPAPPPSTSKDGKVGFQGGSPEKTDPENKKKPVTASSFSEYVSLRKV